MAKYRNSRSLQDKESGEFHIGQRVRFRIPLEQHIFPDSPDFYEGRITDIIPPGNGRTMFAYVIETDRHTRLGQFAPLVPETRVESVGD